MKRLVAPGKGSCPGYAPLPLLAPVQKIRFRALSGLPVLNPIGKQPLTTYPLLRFLAALACLGLFSPPWAFASARPDQPAKRNFSGTRTLDLRASTPLEPSLKEAGASILEQKFAAWVNLTATFPKPKTFSWSPPCGSMRNQTKSLPAKSGIGKHKQPVPDPRTRLASLPLACLNAATIGRASI